jgi:hypothetical protein
MFAESYLQNKGQLIIRHMAYYTGQRDSILYLQGRHDAASIINQFGSHDSETEKLALDATRKFVVIPFADKLNSSGAADTRIEFMLHLDHT